MADPFDTNAEDAAHRVLTDQEAKRRMQWEEDLKWLVAHPAGRRVVCRLLEEAGTFRTSFHASGSTMAFNEGRKQTGYFLTGALMEIAPESYLKLLKEFAHDH